MNMDLIMKLYFGLFIKMKHRMVAKSDRNTFKKRIENKIVLTKEQKKEIKDFYAPYIKVTTLFHQHHLEKTGVYDKRFIPVDIWTNYIDEYFNNRYEAKYMDNKCYYNMLFPGIRQPETVVLRMGEFWYNANKEIISYDEVKSILDNETEIFVKAATEAYGGQGVVYLNVKDGVMSQQFERTIKKGELIVQRPIRQHKDISAINEDSVNTIRIISLLMPDEGVKIYSALLRVGLKGSKVDNVTSGGMTVGITEDGKLRKWAYKRSGDRVDKHPSNGFVFEGYQLPEFEKAKELIKKAHPMIPHFRLVSWDVSIDENGEAVLVEANLCRGAVSIHEINNGPVFGDDTEKILKQVFGGKNKK